MNSITNVFILGNPRSGTSLFRIILNAHKEIIVPPESGFAHWLLPSFSNWNADQINSDELDEFLNAVLRSKKFETWSLNFEALKQSVIENRPKEYPQLVNSIYMAYSRHRKKPAVIGDKNNYYIHHLADLPKIWPGAKYIHIVRDGRDVACSYKDLEKLETNSPYKPDLSTDIEEIALEWSKNNENISRLKNKYSSDYLLIRFEDLITDTVNVCRSVCKFLNVQFDSDMLKYYEANEINGEPKMTLDWKQKTKEKPNKNRIGNYKKKLVQSEIDVFNQLAGMTLSKFNYE